MASHSWSHTTMCSFNYVTIDFAGCIHNMTYKHNIYTDKWITLGNFLKLGIMEFIGGGFLSRSLCLHSFNGTFTTGPFERLFPTVV